MSNSSNDEKECMICFDNLQNYDSSNIIILDCKHVFCYECLLESYKGVKCNHYNVSHRICPYCRKKTTLLPIKEGIQPIKGIHYHNKCNITSTLKICNGVIKSGPKKGCKCTNKVKNGNELYCGKHLSQK